MPSLYFIYSTMNSGKSTELLQIAHNYESSGKRVLLIKPEIDTRTDKTIASRLGISKTAILINRKNIFEIYNNISIQRYDCVLVDESQFLTYSMVEMLANVVDQLKIPVLCYGLKTNFKGKLFEGSIALFELANKIREASATSICKYCHKKSTHVLLKDSAGNVITDGNTIHIGDEEYISVCRHHFRKYFV